MLLLFGFAFCFVLCSALTSDYFCNMFELCVSVCGLYVSLLVFVYLSYLVIGSAVLSARLSLFVLAVHPLVHSSSVMWCLVLIFLSVHLHKFAVLCSVVSIF